MDEHRPARAPELTAALESQSADIARASEIITATAGEIQATFTEWDRRYREDPEKFENEAKRLLTGSPETYGEACLPYFLEILGEQLAKRTPSE